MWEMVLFMQQLAVSFTFLLVTFVRTEVIFSNDTKVTLREDTSTTLSPIVRPNVLLIIADDLRTDLNCYYQGDHQPPQTHPTMHTPNLDALAARSLLFKRAYVQYSLCAPSRHSFLTSRRPDSIKSYNFVTYWRRAVGDFTTLPQYFKQNGYMTVGFGKVFQHGVASGEDDPISWSKPVYRTPLDQGYYRKLRESLWEAIPDRKLRKKPLPDQVIADKSIKALRKLAPRAQSGTQPFFLAVGFVKPHTPFQYPEEFVPLYNDTDMPLPRNKYVAEGMPRLAYHPPVSIKNYRNIKQLRVRFGFNMSLPDPTIRSARAGYYRSASFADAMIGRVLDELTDLGLDKSTIVAFISDHGYHLGEQSTWLKHTNFEVALRAPMIIRAPGLTDQGLTTGALVEFVDLFPTLVDLAGLPTMPMCPAAGEIVKLCTEGVSLLPLFHYPDADFKGVAFSQHLRKKNIMGYSIKTDRYRYTEWVRQGPDWGDLHGRELYDHVLDKDETKNRADESDYASIQADLSGKLQRGWRSVVYRSHQVAQEARLIGHVAGTLSNNMSLLEVSLVTPLGIDSPIGIANTSNTNPVTGVTPVIYQHIDTGPAGKYAFASSQSKSALIANKMVVLLNIYVIMVCLYLGRLS